jgi:hypothetical protein
VQLGSRRERDIANRRSTGPASLGGMSTGFDKQAGFTWADVARFKAAWPGYPLLVKVRRPPGESSGRPGRALSLWFAVACTERCGRTARPAARGCVQLRSVHWMQCRQN